MSYRAFVWCEKCGEHYETREEVVRRPFCAKHRGVVEDQDIIAFWLAEGDRFVNDVILTADGQTMALFEADRVVLDNPVFAISKAASELLSVEKERVGSSFLLLSVSGHHPDIRFLVY